VVGDLEDVDAREAAGEQDRVDPLLDVARQQEAPPGDFAEQDDRDVVDSGTGVGWLTWDGRMIGPQHAETDVVEGEAVARRQQARRGSACAEFGGPGRVSGPRASHAGLEDAPNPVSRQKHRESCDVILVRVRQDDRVDPVVPRGDPFVERHEEPIGIRPAVDEEAAAARALDEDGVALPDVEDGDPGSAIGPMDEDDGGRRDGNEDGERDSTLQSAGSHARSR
jgi:hypothetical protein